jgi:hypothetical protein
MKKCRKADILGDFSSIHPPLSGIEARRRDTRYLLKKLKYVECLQTRFFLNQTMREVPVLIELMPRIHMGEWRYSSTILDPGTRSR